MGEFRKTGVLSPEDLAGKIPPRERLRQGPCAVIECLEEIPCNPCEEACPVGAISVGDPITNIPRLDYEKCVGCGVCLGVCPGLAIFIADLSPGNGKGFLTVPYEFLPVPGVGEEVELLSRAGEPLGKGVVARAQKSGTTWAITVEVPEGLIHEVRAIRRPR